MTKKKNLLLESKQIKFKILTEDLDKEDKVVDGEHILARVQGPAFFPDTTSRNGVHYPLEAWENALEDEDFQRRLKNRLVFGTIGHDPDITDNEVRSGIISHIVSKIWIGDDNVGYAEYLILGTEQGKILNTLLRAGVGISVSTKAFGFVVDEEANPQVVNPEEFTLERIDFVIDPGYLKARPELKESLKSSKLGNIGKESKMSEKALEILEADKKNLQESNKSLQTRLDESVAKETKLTEALKVYQSLGSVKAIQEALALLDSYKALGTVRGIKESLEDSSDVIDELTTQVDELKATIDKANTESEEAEKQANKEGITEDGSTDEDPYKDLGTPEEIKDLLDATEEATNELKQYQELGSLEELRELIAKSEEYAKLEEEASVESLSDEFGVDQETVKLLFAKGLSDEEVEEVLSSLGNVVQGSSEIEEDNEEENEEEEGAGTAEEDDEDKKAAEVSERLHRHSRSSKLIKRMAEAKLRTSKSTKRSFGESNNKRTAKRKAGKPQINENNALLSALVGHLL